METLINLCELLKCTRRTVLSYVERGLIAEPAKENENGIFFYEEDVKKALKIEGTIDKLLTLDEANLYLISINVKYTINWFVNNRHINQYQIINEKGMKYYYMFYELEQLKTFLLFQQIPIKTITEHFNIMSKQSLKIVEGFLSESNFKIIDLFLSRVEKNVLKNYFIDKMTIDEISSRNDIDKYRVRIFIDKIVDKIVDNFSSIQDLPFAFIKQQQLIQQVEEQKIEINFLKNKINNLESNSVNISKCFNSEIKLSDLDFSLRASNFFKKMKITTLRDLLSYSEKDLLKFKKIGPKTLIEIKELLKTKNLELQAI